MEAHETAPLFKADSATLSFYATKSGRITVTYQGLGSKQGCARRVTVRHGPQGGREGAHRGQARRHGCRDGRLHGRGARGNVIDEPTAPQNLELGQVDLIKTEDLSDRWPQG